MIVKIVIRFPPYTLAFGIDTVSPAIVIWHAARIDQYDKEANDLALLTEQKEKEELREKAIIKDLEYKRKMVRYHDDRMKEKELKERNSRVTCINQNKGNLSPKWEEPYIIKEIMRIGVYHLAYEDGQEAARTWHPDNLCKFYQ